MFKDWHQFNYYIYIICEDPEVADTIQTLEMSEEKYERLFGRPRKPLEPKIKPGYEISAQSDMAKKKVNFDHKAVGDETGEETKKLLGSSAYDNESLFSNSLKKRGSKKKASVPDEKTLKAANTSTEEEKFSKLYTVLSKPQTQMEVSEEHQLARLQNHIVVCGIHSSIMHFVLPLRA